MQKETTNSLSKLTNFVKKVNNGGMNTTKEGQMAHRDETKIVSVEPPAPSLDSSFEEKEEQEWNDGLCACSNDLRHCALTAFFPCCMACHEYKIQGEGCGTPLCLGLSILPLTVKYRAKHNIKGSLWKDCLLSLFCYQCQLCRLHRDFKASKNANEKLTLGDEDDLDVTE
ncbi:unnamed protein product [Hymenolepis diminuta]|uniref:Placenta-specific gene 8 protein-like n=1 Tax=Hymenolepis diminuta TaxID=6216 RepID=A0A0R3SM29_HYMDI|nr:unnamed protein product [Hymenolepis diminuta]VUZ47981.1 unnamed protein product [Hymenolepis diminuta]